MIISILLALIIGAIYSLLGYVYLSFDKEISLYRTWKIFFKWLFWPIELAIKIIANLFIGIGLTVIILSGCIYIFILSVCELSEILFIKIKNIFIK
jgi:hypothetical protein